jgi:thiamine-phosphate pyrophosphorylase
MPAKGSFTEMPSSGIATSSSPVRHRFDPSLYLIADPTAAGGRPLEAVVAAAVAGGVTLVQLRCKLGTTRGLLERAQRLKALLRPCGVPLIVNDRIDVMLAAEADGAHIGHEDMPADLARRLIGPDRILGVTLRQEDQARAVDPAVVDYAGVGPIRATTTKADALAPRGVEGFADFRRLVPVRTVAIGGIVPSLAAPLLAAGADGIAVAAAIAGAPDPAAAARRFAGAIAEARDRARPP